MRRIAAITCTFSLFLLANACGGSSAAAPPPATPTPAPTTTGKPAPPPAPIPIVAPEVSEAPASCKELVLAAPAKVEEPKAEKKDEKKDVKAKLPPGPCADAKSAIGVLAAAAAAELAHDRATRDAELSKLSSCERVPLLVTDVLRAELSSMVCAEAILQPALEAHGKEGLPAHQAAARGLVGASRLARLRPKKGAFDLLAKAEVDAAAGEAGTKTVVAWKEAIEKEESEALALAKGAPSEINAIVRFEIAGAWIALAKELRGTPLPDEVKALKSKDPDLETRYFAKLDEVTMPIMDRARQTALGGMGIAVRDGILVKELPSFLGILEPFKSRPGFEARPTRDLDLAIAPLEKDPAVSIAAAFPPWAAYSMLERAAPAELLKPAVLLAFAGNRGVPSSLRLEIEKDKKMSDAAKGAIALARTRTALSYGSRPDADAVAGWKDPKQPVDQLHVAIAKALLGPEIAPPKLGTPAATKVQTGYELKHLDALKQPEKVRLAAAYDAALLALEAAQMFGPDPSDPMATPADQKKAYDAAIARLDAVATLKGLDAARATKAKQLADSARESVKLLGKPSKP